LRLTRVNFGSPKRDAPLDTEQVNVDEAKSKHLRVSAELGNTYVDTSYVCSIQLKTGSVVPVTVNSDETEAKLELIAKEPLIWYETELPLAKVKEGTQKEIASVRTFDAYEERRIETLTQEQLKLCIPTRWVHRAKGLDVKSRIVVKGYKQIIEDKDETFASTPSFVTLKLLLVITIAKNWFCLGGDVSTAFL
jgi:hypothetical protein